MYIKNKTYYIIFYSNSNILIIWFHFVICTYFFFVCFNEKKYLIKRNNIFCYSQSHQIQEQVGYMLSSLLHTNKRRKIGAINTIHRNIRRYSCTVIHFNCIIRMVYIQNAIISNLQIPLDRDFPVNRRD